MRNRAILAFLIVTSLVRIHPDTRTEGVDFVFVIDTSLSMASTMAEAKRYAAGELVGRLVESGDWLCIVKFYEKSEILWSGEVKADADIAQAVRSLNALKADGRFTDIGAALDRVDALLLERGHPERPKYVVLVTDERQEAPKGTEYYSADYTIKHPALDYVKRVDLGGFRAITIGYGLASKVEGGARSLLTTLSAPPASSARPLAGSSGSVASGGSGTQAADAAGSSPDSAAGANGQGSAGASGRAGASGGPGGSTWMWIAGAAAAVAALAAILALAFRRRGRKNPGKPGDDTEEAHGAADSGNAR